MATIISLLKIVLVMAASILVGNWFLDELKKAKATGKPWYCAYLTIPGLIIILALIGVPILLWLVKK